MGLFDRWFGAGVTDPTVAARQRSAAWGAFLAQQRAALPPIPVADAVPLATAPTGVTLPVVPALAPIAGSVIAPSASPVSAPSHRAAPTTVLVIEDGEEGV